MKTGIERQVISIHQFCNLLELDPARFIGLQVMRQSHVIWIFMEPINEPNERNTAGADHAPDATPGR